jgi:wyosine [tRNA(Phe)-imidazoG37] synthetase (radical SAM superfamily)
MLSLQRGIIYGPVPSRRLGKSLGINISPVAYKLCSFNCVYCHYGWTKAHTRDATPYLSDLPSAGDVEAALKSVLNSVPQPDYITFSGNGESTLHPDFSDIVERVSFVRDSMAPAAGLALISNSSCADSVEVRKAMRLIDLKMMKLDCGNEESFNRFNGPCAGITFDGILESLIGLSDIVIQAMMVKGDDGNFTEESESSWSASVSRVRPLWVQLYSIDGPTPGKQIEPAPRQELLEMAERCQRATGVKIRVY